MTDEYFVVPPSLVVCPTCHAIIESRTNDEYIHHYAAAHLNIDLTQYQSFAGPSDTIQAGGSWSGAIRHTSARTGQVNHYDLDGNPISESVAIAEGLAPRLTAVEE